MLVLCARASAPTKACGFCYILINGVFAIIYNVDA
jgi:hypothetical protein